MASPSQPSRENIPPERESPPVAPGPLSPSDLRTLFVGSDIWKTLGRLEEAVEGLKETRKSHDEKIQQLIRQTDETKFHVPILEGAIARHGAELIQQGKEVHTAKVLGNIALYLVVGSTGIIAAVFAYFYHRLAPLLSNHP